MRTGSTSSITPISRFSNTALPLPAEEPVGLAMDGQRQFRARRRLADRRRVGRLRGGALPRWPHGWGMAAMSGHEQAEAMRASVFTGFVTENVMCSHSRNLSKRS